MPARDYATYHTWLKECGDLIGKHVLDLGCGSGKSSILLAQSGASVVGVDISLEMIKIAEDISKKSEVDIRYIHEDARTLRKFENYFPIITAAYLLHYSSSITDLDNMVQGIANNLEDGGMFVGLNQNPIDPANEFNIDTQIARKWIGNPFENGSSIEVIIGDSKSELISFRHYHWNKDVYEESLKKHGFIDIQWIKPVFREDMRDSYPEWKNYEDDANKVTVLKATKMKT